MSLKFCGQSAMCIKSAGRACHADTHAICESSEAEYVGSRLEGITDDVADLVRQGVLELGTDVRRPGGRVDHLVEERTGVLRE